MALPRNAHGRLVATYSRNQLLGLIRSVALEATGGDVDAARRLSKGAWTGSVRAQSKDCDIPTAETIRQRLGGTWEEIRAIALGPQEAWARRLGLHATRFDPTPPSDELAMANALRRVARELDGPPTTSSYETVRQRINTARTRKDHQTPLPGIRAILDHFGSFEHALRATGLREHYPYAPKAPGDAISGVELLDRYISEVGILPTRDTFRAWHVALDYPPPHEVRDWMILVGSVREHRARRGDPTRLTRRQQKMRHRLRPQSRECAGS